MHENFKASNPREHHPNAFKEAESCINEQVPRIDEKKLREICRGDQILEQLVESVIEYSCRYAEDVMRMHEFAASGKLSSAEYAAEFAAMDDSRTRLHTATVDSFNILSRALAKAGRDNSWMHDLQSRAAVGALAVELGIRHFLEMENGAPHE